MKKVLLLLTVLGLLLTSVTGFAQARGRQAGRFSRQSADGLRVSPGGSRPMRSYGEGRKWSRVDQHRTPVKQMPKVSPPHGAKTHIKEFEKPNLDEPEISLMPSKISGEVTTKKAATGKEQAAAPAVAGMALAAQEQGTAPVSKTEMAKTQQDQSAALKQAQDMARQMGVELPADVQQMMAGGGAAPGAMPNMPAGMPDMSKMMGGNMPAGMPDISKMMQGGAQ